MRIFLNGVFKLAYVFGGGILGTVVRFEIVQNIHYEDGWEILIVNILACFLAGVLTVLVKNEFLRKFTVVGFLGGFSTVAAVTLLYTELPLFTGLVYLVATFALSLVACVIGMKVARK